MTEKARKRLKDNRRLSGQNTTSAMTCIRFFFVNFFAIASSTTTRRQLRGVLTWPNIVLKKKKKVDVETEKARRKN